MSRQSDTFCKNFAKNSKLQILQQKLLFIRWYLIYWWCAANRGEFSKGLQPGVALYGGLAVYPWIWHWKYHFLTYILFLPHVILFHIEIVQPKCTSLSRKYFSSFFATVSNFRIENWQTLFSRQNAAHSPISETYRHRSNALQKENILFVCVNKN